MTEKSLVRTVLRIMLNWINFNKFQKMVGNMCHKSGPYYEVGIKISIKCNIKVI